MKTINEIYEGILNDIDKSIEDTDHEIKKLEIIKTLNSYLAKKLPEHKINQLISFDFSKDIPVIDVKCSVYISHSQKLDGLTDGSFEFGKIYGHFVVSETDFVTSLKYGPKYVLDHGDFDLSGMARLKSLNGCPQGVEGDMYIHTTGVQVIDYLPEQINGNLHIVGNSHLKKSDVLKSGNTCNIEGYIAASKNSVQFTLNDFKNCNVRHKKANMIEGILDDVDIAIEKSDNIVKERERANKLSKLNIPTINNLYRDKSGMFFCWELPDSIMNMIKPYIAKCVNTMEKRAGDWFKDWIIKGASRIKIRCNGKILEFKLIRNDSADGTVFFRLQGKDYYTFGKNDKNTFEHMIKITEQLALYPEILVEMLKDPSTRSKDTQKYYDKLMAAE